MCSKLPTTYRNHVSIQSPPIILHFEKETSTHMQYGQTQSHLCDRVLEPYTQPLLWMEIDGWLDGWMGIF